MSYTIEQVGTKNVKTKFGEKPTYSFKADGEWFKCGFKNPRVNAGDVVEFEFTEGAYGKDVNMDSFKKSSGSSGGSAPVSAPAASAPRPAGGFGGGKGVFPIPPLDGQRAIVRQNSLTNAVNLLKDTLGGDKKLSDVAKAEQVIAIARLFEAYSCGDSDLAKAKEKLATPKKVETKDEESENAFEEA